MDDANTLAHAKVGSWFLGPRAENFHILESFFRLILDEQRTARQSIYNDDPDFITQGMMETTSFQDSIEKLQADVRGLSGSLATGSIPFWSPRYNAHMNMDTTMPSIIGCRISLLNSAGSKTLI